MTNFLHWVDAETAPSLPQATQAVNLGHVACGFYVADHHGTDPARTWSQSEVNVLRQAGLKPVPIVVPSPSLPVDAVTCANEAYAAALAVGCQPCCSVLYDGNHISKSGQIAGPVWLPLPGGLPSGVGAQSAIQYGQTSIAGWSVDLNVAAADFPFDDAIAVDFEYNTADNIAWYQAFQSRIAVLSGGAPITTTEENDDVIIYQRSDGLEAVLGPLGLVGLTAEEKAAYDASGAAVRIVKNDTLFAKLLAQRVLRPEFVRNSAGAIIDRTSAPFQLSFPEWQAIEADDPTVIPIQSDTIYARVAKEIQ